MPGCVHRNTFIVYTLHTVRCGFRSFMTVVFTLSAVGFVFFTLVFTLITVVFSLLTVVPSLLYAVLILSTFFNISPDFHTRDFCLYNYKIKKIDVTEHQNKDIWVTFTCFLQLTHQTVVYFGSFDDGNLFFLCLSSCVFVHRYNFT